jgi:hypothetical protein
MARAHVVVRRGPGLIGTMVRTAVLAGAPPAVERTTAAYRRERREDDVAARLLQLTELAEAGILTKDEYHAGMSRLLHVEPGPPGGH